jgi:hypothetical protein
VGGSLEIVFVFDAPGAVIVSRGVVESSMSVRAYLQALPATFAWQIKRPRRLPSEPLWRLEPTAAVPIEMIGISLEGLLHAPRRRHLSHQGFEDLWAGARNVAKTRENFAMFI